MNAGDTAGKDYNGQYLVKVRGKFYPKEVLLNILNLLPKAPIDNLEECHNFIIDLMRAEQGLISFEATENSLNLSFNSAPHDGDPDPTNFHGDGHLVQTHSKTERSSLAQLPSITLQLEYLLYQYERLKQEYLNVVNGSVPTYKGYIDLSNYYNK